MLLLLLILSGVFALALVFISCELGHRINEAFDAVNVYIEQLDWYAFPVEIQRMLPMIIANVQQPVPLDCFGSITCTRAVFKDVGIQHASKSAVSNLVGMPKN